jgi:hypothetical protein
VHRLALAALAACLVAASWSQAPRGLPPIVFASRAPAAEPGAVPGLGPHQRALATGGRLLLRERDGRVRELIAAGALHDVSDPAVSFDGHTVAFAATPAADSAWRIYLVRTDGTGLRAVTRTEEITPATRATPMRRYDDLDPCWVAPDLLCFASTRYPQRAQYADVPVTNLHLLNVGASPLRLPWRGGSLALAPGTPLRITAERNGAEEPALDPTTGRIVYARWWFNRHRPGSGVALATVSGGRLGADSVNLWQPITITVLGRDARLPAGTPAARRATMAYQPAVLRDGSLLGVYAANLGLSPGPVALGIQRLDRSGRVASRLAGAIVSDAAGDAYQGTVGLAAASACAPAALPDGRVLFSYSPGGRGDYGLHVMRADGSGIEPVLDLPGTLELDAVPLVARRPVRLAIEPREASEPERAVPVAFVSSLPPLAGGRLEDRGTFRFSSLDVFGGATRGRAGKRSPAGPPPRTAGARIRFWGLFATPERAGGDTAVLLRERPVGWDGQVDERLPADVPLFEQLVDSAGAVLRSAHEPAHVAGLNAGSPGSVARCIGCHVGHSVVRLPARDRGPGRAGR